MESSKVKQIRQRLAQNNWTILEGKEKDNTRQDKTREKKTGKYLVSLMIVTNLDF